MDKTTFCLSIHPFMDIWVAVSQVGLFDISLMVGGERDRNRQRKE